MRRFERGCSILLLCVLLFACARTGKTETSPPSYLAARPCGERHLLWKASKGNLPEIWLLGSIHLADSTFYPLPEIIDSALERVSIVAAELDILADSTASRTEELVRERGMLPGNVRLRQVLSDSLYRQIDSLAAAWNFPVAVLEGFRPWMVAVSLSAIAFERTGLSGEYGIDREILFRAEDRGKEIFALETPGEQIGIFSDAEDSLGVSYLESTLKEIRSADSVISSIQKAWKCGDAQTLRKILSADSSDDALEEKLYTDRNIRMAESLDSLSRAGRSVFAVVGCAHLVGSGKNVLALLEDMGYRIEAR